MNIIKSIIAVSVALAITACSEQESAQTYITEAESLLVKEQHNAAIIALKNALKMGEICLKNIYDKNIH